MKRARPRSVPRAALAPALALLGALALWWLWPAGSVPEPPPPKAAPAKGAPPPPDAAAARGAAPSPRAGGEAPAASGERPFDDHAVARQAKRFDALDHTIELTRFPPDSRPLRPEMADVLEPNRRHEQPRPLAAGGGARGQKVDPERDLFVLFTGPRYAVAPGEKLAATLEVFRGRPEEGRAGERVAIEVRACILRGAGPQPLAENLPINDRGEHGDQRAGDLTFSLAVDPLSLPGVEHHNGAVHLDVTFVAPGAGEPEHASLDFKLNATPPARFNGRVAEKLKPEGLELRVGLDVDKPGRYVVQGLLFDARDKPVGFAVDRPTLKPGAGEASLLFFGLLFHEAEAQAPFVLRTVTGYLLPEGDEPDKFELAQMPGEYRTHAYSLRDFSTDEWQSASKDRRLEAIRELAEKNPDKTLVSGTPAETTPAPASSP